jgi:hypothetical protein
LTAEEFHKHKPKDVKPQGALSGLDADKLDGFHASEIGSGGPHATTHEVDGADLVRPYLPVAGCWTISGAAAPFALMGDDSLKLYVEGVLYFDVDSGKMKVTA